MALVLCENEVLPFSLYHSQSHALVFPLSLVRRQWSPSGNWLVLLQPTNHLMALI